MNLEPGVNIDAPELMDHEIRRLHDDWQYGRKVVIMSLSNAVGDLINLNSPQDKMSLHSMRRVLEDALQQVGHMEDAAKWLETGFKP